MLKKIAPLCVLALVLVLPVAVSAQQIDAQNGLGELFKSIVLFLSRYIIPLFIAIAVIWFLWGVVQFVTHAGDEAERTKGKDRIIWGLVGLFVMLSVWGLVNLLKDTVNTRDRIQGSDFPGLPTHNQNPTS